MNLPRLVISGLSGGSGKTLLSLSLTRAFTRLGLVVQPCKKGPDYIDAAWLTLAAGRDAANLDPWFLPPDRLRARFLEACLRPAAKPEPFSGVFSRSERTALTGNAACDLALVEGNRGLYDGRDAGGSCSTAQVARTLDAPVILALNCAKMTRTAAALVLGVKAFDPDMHLAGVVINNTGSARHAAQVRQAIEHYTDVPVLGSLPRMRDNPLPERHMGLTLHQADPEAEAILERLADYVSMHADLGKILDIVRRTPAFAVPVEETAGGLPEYALSRPDAADPGGEGGKSPLSTAESVRPRIGYVYDDALWFYYRENLDALAKAGACLVRLSILDPAPWPELDGLYLGGGFPELYAAAIAASPHLAGIRALSEAGRPVYAECGGFMILAQSLEIEGKTYSMSGVLTARTRFYPRPQGLGYVEATTVRPNPFHPVGSVWRGHEFHYSRCELVEPGQTPPHRHVLKLSPGTGMSRAEETAEGKGGQDGLCVRHTFASYTHLYAPAVPHWAARFVAAAKER